MALPVTPELDLVLEVIGHEWAAVIMAERCPPIRKGLH
jgi:hypothetical protein